MNAKILKKLQSYHAPAVATELINNSRVVFFVGVTGAGKDTILKHLLKNPDYHHVVSHTTRPPRKNHGVMEEDGVDYHFIDFETAEYMLDNGGYIEAKQFSNNIYGTSLAEIQMAHDEGKIALTDIEVQGVAEYYEISNNIIPIFIIPPSFKVWLQRLENRHESSAMDKDELKRRMQTAEFELKEALEKPYFEYLVNDDLDKSIEIANELAHGQKSAEKNEKARQVALELLEDLDEYIANL